jgi:hypothetical protein
MEYRIVTLADLFMVPRDRWDALLADLREWMNYHQDHADETAAEVAKLLGCDATPLRIMTWCDDNVVGFNGGIQLHPSEPT